MGSVPSTAERRIAGIAALDQPLRHDLYRLLSDGNWRTRDDAAAALGLPRSVVAFHLDKLLEAGVLQVRYQRLSGRRGPGAGRPSKLYALAADELAASVPERHYDLAGAVLVEAVAESARAGTDVLDRLREAARAAGRSLGEQVRGSVAGASTDAERRDAVVAALEANGYEPTVVGREIVLANCPFHRLAEQERDLICGMNLDLLTGFLEGVGRAEGLSPRLQPEPGCCCVRIAAA